MEPTTIEAWVVQRMGMLSHSTPERIELMMEEDGTFSVNSWWLGHPACDLFTHLDDARAEVERLKRTSHSSARFVHITQLSVIEGGKKRETRG